MNKKILKITIFHIIIILFWSFLYSKKLLIEDEGILNITSFTLLYTVYLLIYGEISNKGSQKTRNFFIFLSLGLLSISSLKDLRYNFLLIILSIISTAIFFKKFIDLKVLKHFNILPISKKMTVFFTLSFIIFSFLLIYLLELDSFVLNIFFQVIFLTFELCFNLFLIDRENNYENNYKLYYLSDYMANERNEFARIIHDDIIQDIYAVKNYLSLKKPDINYSREVLNNLESKSRRIMKFYQNSLFEEFNLEENIIGIFENIKNLYPNKKINIDKTISKDLEKIKGKNTKK